MQSSFIELAASSGAGVHALINDQILATNPPESKQKKNCDASQIDALIRYGVRVFPVKQGAKEPLIKGWPDKASADPAQVEAWRKQYPGCNWGACCGPLLNKGVQLLVIDCDSPGAFDWLCRRWPDAGKTATVSTGRGSGVHVYFLAPATCKMRNGAKLKLPGDAPDGAAIDVRCEGGYAVAPGSIHPSGREYKWRPGSFDEKGHLHILGVPAEWCDGRDSNHLFVGAPAPAQDPAQAQIDLAKYAPGNEYGDGDWGRFEAWYKAALEGELEEIASCDDGEGHSTVIRCAKRLYEITQPDQPDPKPLILAAVQRWTLRKDDTWARVRKDADRACEDARKSVTVKPWRDVLKEADLKAAARGASTAAGAHGVDVAQLAKAAAGDRPWVAEMRRARAGADAPFTRCAYNLQIIISRDVELLGRLCTDIARDLIYWEQAPRGREDSAGCELCDEDFTRAVIAISTEYGIEFPKNTVRDALCAQAADNKHNSFVNWINSAPWDGVDRLSSIGTLFGAQGLFASEKIRRWMRAACARQEASAKNYVQCDHLLVLRGAQGIGKTTGLKALTGPDYFTTAVPNFDDKDTLLKIHRAPVVCFDELGAKRQDQNKLKEGLTRTEDDVRKPYGYGVRRAVRHCVFCATTNEDEPLIDASGGRRYWLVDCTARVQREVLRAHAQQLWAQAWSEYRAGARWWFDETADAAACEQLAREQADATEVSFEEQLCEAFKANDRLRMAFENPAQGVTIRELVEEIWRGDYDHNTLFLKYKDRIRDALRVRFRACLHRTKSRRLWFTRTPLDLS